MERNECTLHPKDLWLRFAIYLPKQESNYQIILLFFHFSEICGHAHSDTRWKQNYQFDLAELLKVAVYENLLQES